MVVDRCVEREYLVEIAIRLRKRLLLVLAHAAFRLGLAFLDWLGGAAHFHLLGLHNYIYLSIDQVHVNHSYLMMFRMRSEEQVTNILFQCIPSIPPRLILLAY